MSRYYRKTNYKKSNKKNWKDILLTFFIICLALGAIAAVVKVFDVPTWFDKEEEVSTEYVNVHLVPGEIWSSDGSNYGAWVWNDKGVPEGEFLLATDEDEDGVFTVSVHKDYNRMLFVDLVPEATELGEDWKNKREQSSNLAVPTDDNIYYHQYANEWSKTSDILYTVTTSEVNVYFETSGDWAVFQAPVVYYFDKTGKNEPNFLQLTQVGASQYFAYIPAGYTHIIFLEYDDGAEVGTWDNVLNQTSDLVIPTGEANHYDLSTNEWFVPEEE